MSNTTIFCIHFSWKIVQHFSLIKTLIFNYHLKFLEDFGEIRHISNISYFNGFVKFLGRKYEYDVLKIFLLHTFQILFLDSNLTVFSHHYIKEYLISSLISW